MSLRVSVAVSILVVLACIVVATPAKAVQPGPKSYTLFNVTGGVVECIDFKNNGKANALLSGVSGKWFGAPVSDLIPDPPNGFADFVGDSIYAGNIRNWFPWDETSTRTDFHGTCETQGTAIWTFIGEDPAGASCSMTSFNRYPFYGRRSNSWSMIGLTGSCADFWLSRPESAPIGVERTRKK